MRRRIQGIAAAVILVGILLLALLGGGNIGAGSSNALGQFAAPGSVEPAAIRHLGEIGPGACWPGDTRPSGGQDVGFASIKGPKEAAAWLRANPKAAERYTRWLAAHKDYYLIYEVVPAWDNLSEVERAASYVERTTPVKMLTSIRVQNTSCKDGDVSLWEIQILPVEEWVFFAPGHEPGTADPRPVFKAVCGNPLLPPVEATPPAPQAPPVITGTPPPGCEGSGCNPPPPTCKKSCNPPCTTCTNNPKKPNEAPGQGGAGDGGASKYGGTGSDRQVATGPAAPPKAGNPPPAYTPPPQPTNNNPPAGSTSTNNQPPPPPPGVNPPGGGGNGGTVPEPP